MKILLFMFLAFFLLYFFAFPQGLSTEYSLKPVWTAKIADSNGNGDASQGEPFPFRIGTRFCYLNDLGTVQFSDSVLFDVALSNKLFINYSQVGGNLVLQDPTGRVLSSLETRGYPILAKGRFFVISSNRKILSEYDETGALLWKSSFPSLITAVDVHDYAVLLGTLNGKLLLVDNEGNVESGHQTTESRINVIYGCAMSPYGEHIAAVHGIDSQIISVFHLREKEIVPVSRYADNPEQSLRRNSFTSFDGEGRIFFVERKSSIYVMDIAGILQSELLLQGSLVHALASEFQELFVALERAESTYVLSLWNFPSLQLAKGNFAGDEASVAVRKGHLLLGMDEWVARYDIARE